MKAALYARYSSDQQRLASIADQFRVCREYTERQGWTVAATFEDAAMSGASLMRPGFQALMREALAGAFDVVLAESLDRFSRDQEDTAGLFKRLSYAGVRIVTLAEGDIGHLHVGFKGTMNALYLTDLADKTRRGLRGRVEAGKSGGGLCYGYRVVQAPDGQARGDREIHPDEAVVVQRIFRAFADGRSPKAIAKQLNAERIPGPSGHPWWPNTIAGQPKRGTGVLNNELYVGRIVWNRLRYVKDPDTGRRRSRLNPPASWVTVEAQHLRIIDDELWQAAKARQTASRRRLQSGQPLVRLRRPAYLFSGLLFCGSCGGRYVVATNGRFACNAARMAGTCDNRLRIARAEIDRRVLKALREDLLDPDLFADFCDGFTEEVNRQRRTQRAALAQAKRELSTVERQIRAIVDAVKNGFATRAMAAELQALEQRQDELSRALTMPAPPSLHPHMATVYREQVTALCDALTLDTTATAQIRDLVEKLVIQPDGGIVVHGNLAAMLTLAHGKKAPTEDLASVIKMVAGGGFEPPTFGL